MENRKIISVLIPYKITDGQILVYLQKRAKDRKRLPNFFGFFGGGAEDNETPEQVLVREIKEELDFTVSDYKLLENYHFDNGSIMNVFTLPVSEDWENKIKVLEGDYGKFFNEQEIANEPLLIAHDKEILSNFFAKIKNAK